MTAALSLRRRDEGKKPLAAQILLYPEARLPFDTPAASENNSGYYLECNGISPFADYYLPRGTPPGVKYISPGIQTLEELENLPPATIFTSGFDPLRDVGVEYAKKLEDAGNHAEWKHYDTMTHGWLQMTAWSEEAKECVEDVAVSLRKSVYNDGNQT